MHLEILQRYFLTFLSAAMKDFLRFKIWITTAYTQSCVKQEVREQIKMAFESKLIAESRSNYYEK